MSKYVLAKKIGMTQVIQDSGEVTPVTVLEATDCEITAVKTIDSDGYNAIQVGSGEKPKKKVTKSLAGIFKGKVPNAVKEFRTTENDSFEKGAKLTLSQFDENERVNVSSKSIGKGFAGTVKRHGFARGPMTHGSKNHRLPGSIGGGTDPGRVFKGTRMGGHMGNSKVVTKNLLVVKVDESNGLIYIKGSVPGKKNNLVEIYQVG